MDSLTTFGVATDIEVVFFLLCKVGVVKMTKCSKELKRYVLRLTVRQPK